MLSILASTFVLVVVELGVLALISKIMIDACQTQDTIRQNYTVIGAFQRVFSELAEFFREHSFAVDREGMPFSRQSGGSSELVDVR